MDWGEWELPAGETGVRACVCGHRWAHMQMDSLRTPGTCVATRTLTDAPATCTPFPTACTRVCSEPLAAQRPQRQATKLFFPRLTDVPTTKKTGRDLGPGTGRGSSLRTGKPLGGVSGRVCRERQGRGPPVALCLHGVRLRLRASSGHTREPMELAYNPGSFQPPTHNPPGSSHGQGLCLGAG